MRFTAAAVLLLAGSSSAFQPVVPKERVSVAAYQSAATEDAAEASKKSERLRMMKSEQFHRRGFAEVREGVEQTMEEQFQAKIVNELRESDYSLERDGVKVKLAKVRLLFFCQLYLPRTHLSSHISQDFGFCWGVERSIALAYEAVEHFPGKNVHMTNELIHNPEVNENLENMNVKFLEKIGDGKKNFETVQDGDVVILPAFGASYEEMDLLDKKVS